MKRIAIASAAAFLALTLFVAPAMAAGNPPAREKQITEGPRGGYHPRRGGRWHRGRGPSWGFSYSYGPRYASPYYYPGPGAYYPAPVYPYPGQVYVVPHGGAVYYR